MDKPSKTPQGWRFHGKRAQSAIEYLFLLGVVVSIAIVSFSNVMPGVYRSSDRFFNETSNVIMGDDPVAVCTPGGWTAWTFCPPCNGGNRTRVCTDTCGIGCFGAASEACEFVPCPGIAGGWCPWGACNAPCGPSLWQSRSCNCPAPSGGGALCVGNTTQQCPPVPCTGGLCLWDPWLPDPCPVLCGGAEQTRLCVCDAGAPQGSTCLPDADGTTFTRICNPQLCECPATSVTVTCGMDTSGAFTTWTIDFPITPSNFPPTNIYCPELCYGMLTYACVDGSWNYSTALCQPSCSTGIRNGICDPGIPGAGEWGGNCPGDCCDSYTGCGNNNAFPTQSCKSVNGQPYGWIEAADLATYCDGVSDVCLNYYTCGGNSWICGPTPGTWTPMGGTCYCGDGFCHDATNSGGLTEKCGTFCNATCPGACAVDCSPCCGDGSRNGAEECDGSDFGPDSCVARGFTTGNLYCRGDCITDTSGCCTGVGSSCNACNNPPYCGNLNGTDNCGLPCSAFCGACPVCPGNGCERPSEDCESCAADCGACACPDGYCTASDGGPCGCPTDCGGGCGDSCCTNPPESCLWCFTDCGVCCTGGGGGCSSDGECCSRCCDDGSATCGSSSGNCF